MNEDKTYFMQIASNTETGLWRALSQDAASERCVVEDRPSSLCCCKKERYLASLASISALSSSLCPRVDLITCETAAAVFAHLHHLEWKGRSNSILCQKQTWWQQWTVHSSQSRRRTSWHPGETCSPNSSFRFSHELLTLASQAETVPP